MCPFSCGERADPTLKRGQIAQVQVQSTRKSTVPQPPNLNQELQHPLQRRQRKHLRPPFKIHPKQHPKRQQPPTLSKILKKTANRPLKLQRTTFLLREISPQRFLEQEVQYHPHQGLKPQRTQRSLEEERRVSAAELKIPAEEDVAAQIHQGSSFSASKIVKKEGGGGSREEGLKIAVRLFFLIYAYKQTLIILVIPPLLLLLSSKQLEREDYSCSNR